MFIKLFLAIILLLGLGFVVEKILFVVGYGFTFLENATVLLVVITLLLLNKIYELKAQSNQLKAQIEEEKLNYIKGVESLKEEFANELEQKKQDRETFDRLMKALPKNGSVAFLRTGSYLITLFNPQKELKDFLELEKRLGQSSYIFYFYDEQLEQVKNELMRSLPRTLMKIKTCLAKQHKDDQDYRFDLDLKPCSENCKDIVEEVSIMVGDFLEKYDELRKVAKNNLGCI